MSELVTSNRWLEASTYKQETVWLEIADGDGSHFAELSVEEAVQFSRMIVKAAAQAAGLDSAQQRPSEAPESPDPTGDTGTP